MLRDPSLIPLSHQHHNGLALCVLTDRELAQDGSAANIERLGKRAIDRYAVELINHFELEEQILFPACESDLTARLREEHRQIEALIGKLRAQPAAALLTEFTSLLRSHIRQEENELFESVQKQLPRETLDRLGAEIDSKAVRVCL
ncbi:MAG: hemerythrin domain-containing protein [Acidimicrobiia bacterium]|nr:hemerythrin domain-containing protein [Acidimicrobiia bacterium]